MTELAKRRGIDVDERAFFPEELSSFSGRCQTGSTADVTPVSEIGPYCVTPATIAETLMNDYMKESIRPPLSPPNKPSTDHADPARRVRLPTVSLSSVRTFSVPWP